MPSQVKLVEMSLVKEMCNIAQADTYQNQQLRAAIAQASADVEHATNRKYEYAADTEYCQSYDQQPYDPFPQYCFVPRYPIDLTKSVVITWAPNEMHDQMGATLDSTDYQIDAERGCFIIRRTTGVFQGIIPLIRGRLIFCYAPRGFRIQYTGGYKALNPAPAGYVEGAMYPGADPLDDYDVPDVPLGLRMVIARKIAEDWSSWRVADRDPKMFVLKPWTTEQTRLLHPYRKNDVLFE